MATLPVIHLNGSGKRNLVLGFELAAEKLHDAGRAIQLTAPHMRDFYVLPDGQAKFDAAQKEHIERLEKIVAVMQEMEAIAIAIDSM